MPEILRRVLRPFASRRMASRLDEEMRFHVDMATAKNMRDGMAEDDARRAALVDFGASQRFREEARDEVRGRMLDDLSRHIRYALRTLQRSPAFAVVVVLTLALGIGANTALFSVYDKLILNPVTFPEPDTLIAIVTTNPQLPGLLPSLAWTRYREIQAHNDSFSSVGISAFDSFTITGNGEPEQLNALRVSSTFFPTLGVLPVLGRNFEAEEDVPNGPSVCMISHEFWQTRFGGQPGILDKTITLNGQPWQVVGILPPHLSPPYRQTQVFAPRVFEVGGLTAAQIESGAGYAQPIGRLKKGVTLKQARAELAAISRGYRERFGGKLDAANTTEAQLFVKSLVGSLEPTFYTLLAAVAFVLLIACANVASLCLGRIVARHKELAVRRSLGATRARVVQQFLIESLIISVVAGLLGILVGYLAISAIQTLVSAQLPPNTVLTLSVRALAFTTAIIVVTAVLIGLAPALQASRANVGDALKDCVRGSTGEQAGRFRSVLIVAEVAMSVILLVGSSLLLISFLKLQRTPSGFEPKGAAAAFVALSTTQYKTPAQQAEFFSQVVERLRSQPHVTNAAAAIGLPLSGFVPRSPYSVAGRAVLPLPQRPLAGLSIVSEDYFTLMRIQLREGRAFSADDREGAPGVCIINESLAKKLFPGESAIGKILMRGRDAEIMEEIVGVIRDVKTLGATVPAPDEIYHPMRQLGRPGMAIVARTDGDPALLQPTLRAAVTAVDKNQPISFFSTLENNVALSLAAQKTVAALTSVFAGVATLLSAIGLYSVLAYAVSRRTPEIGIRMALGAKPKEVIGLVMRAGLRLVALGLGIGILGAAAAARLIQTLLFNVQPLDPIVYIAVVILFSGIAALACLAPSIRASRIDPLIAMRAE